MADDADRADDPIQATIDAGRVRARNALKNPRLRPIVQIVNGKLISLCHYCESDITTNHLFCPNDPIEPEHSCALMWEHARQRKEAMGL